MRPQLKQIGVMFLLLGIATGAAAPAAAANVRAALSARETYVGAPVMLQIEVSGGDDAEPPTIPQVDGLEITSRGTPSRSTHISSINGRMTTRTTLTFVFEVTPQRGGSFRIPPITVRAGGAEHKTQALTLVAATSETGDLLFVEIAGKEKQIYVGQALDVTLQIWIRPYRSREHNLTLSERDMWRLVSERSTWGLFADRMKELAENNQRPVGSEVLRKDATGVERSYYLYEIPATIYPKRPGKIDAADTRIVVNYPTAIGQARDPFAGFFEDMPFAGGRTSMFGGEDAFSPFGSRLAVESVRPIVAETGGPAIDVLPIPTADRPADYRGAVGKYLIVTSAAPSSVKAGDPIELSIGIAGSGPMDLVQAPPLAELPALTADFKVPSEPLAGFVKDSRKLFTTTIRPRRAGITHIPPIPFSFFDPESAKFVTVKSEPIAIHVDPADTLALDAIVGKSSSTTSGDDSSSDKAEKASAASVLFTGDNLLKSDKPRALGGRLMLALLALPPLMVGALLVLRGGRRWGASWIAIGSSTRALERRLSRAQTATEVASILRGYLGRSLRLNYGSDDPAVVGALRSAGYRQLAIRVERILGDSASGYATGGQVPRDLSGLKQDVLNIVRDFEAERLQKRRRPAPLRRSAVKAATVLVMMACASAVGTKGVMAAEASDGASSEKIAAASAAETKELPSGEAAYFALTPAQQKLLLEEATACYQQALAHVADDPASAKQGFSEAADKYDLLVRSGIENSRLETNLANAYLHSGEVEKAVQNYRRAIEIDPTNRTARRGLALAEASAGAKPAAATNGDATDSALSQFGQTASNWIASYLSPLQMQLAVLVSWFVLWAAIAGRVLGSLSPWKSATAAMQRSSER